MKPRRSLNMTVASPRTPPSRTPSASASTWSTTASGTKRANASRACSRSNATVERRGSAPVSEQRRERRRRAVDDRDDHAVVERELGADEDSAPSATTPIGSASTDPQPQGSERRGEAEQRRSAATFEPPGALRSGKPSSAVSIDVRRGSPGPGISAVAGRRGRVEVLQRRRRRADDDDLAACTSAGSKWPRATSTKLSVRHRVAAARRSRSRRCLRAGARIVCPARAARRGDRERRRRPFWLERASGGRGRPGR